MLKEKGNTLMWFIIILAVIWVLWFFTGGPERANQEGNKPFLKPLEPVDSGELYGPQN